MSLISEVTKGIYKENPVFRLALGLCPTLAVSTSITNAIGMGAATTFVLLCSNIIISLLILLFSKILSEEGQKSINKIKKFLNNFSNLQTIGRNGLHRYNNQDHSMLTGIYAARNLTGANYDIWSVNTEIEHHEDSVLSDS